MSNQIAETAARYGINREALRTKYRAERDKRAHPKGAQQFIEVHNEYQSLRDDPFVEPHHKREALEDEVSVVVIGGGFGGMLAAVRLRQQGVHDIRIIDAAGDFGGTWYWNRYPGAQCDIESYCYFPLLEEMGYMPKERYSYGPEIFAYAQSIAQKFDLYDVACFQTSVTGQIWDEDSARWVISTDRGDTCLLYTSPSPRDRQKPRMPSSA